MTLSHSGNRMPWVQIWGQSDRECEAVRRHVPHTLSSAISRPQVLSEPGLPSAVVILAKPGSGDVLSRILGMATALGVRDRVILVTSPSPKTAVWLAQQEPVRLVWEDSLHLLARVLHDLCSRGLRARMSDLIRRRSKADERLSHAIRTAFSSEVPPNSVAELAKSAFCSDQTLRRRWRRFRLPEGPYALVEWSILSHLAELRGNGLKIHSIARQTQVHDTTIYRLARRRLRCPASSVTDESVFLGFTAWLDEKAVG